jgi:uncharacterized protein DUF1236
MTKTMTKTLMITASVAALVAAGGLAIAQGTNEPRENPRVTAPNQASKSDRLKVDTPSKTDAAKTDAAKPGPSAQLPAKRGSAKSDTTGQGSAVPRDAASDPAAAKPQQRVEEKHAAPAALSAEHHARIWEAIRGEKMARFTGEKFAMTVGGLVPPAVHLNRLPVQIMEYAPQYRGYEYVQVGEEILIVDPRTHRIIAA